MRPRIPLALLLLVLAAPSRAWTAEPSAREVAKRVGQVFGGYRDFWVWMTQRNYAADGTPASKPLPGRAYFKRKEKFRLNFGRKPVLEIHGSNEKVARQICLEGF